MRTFVAIGFPQNIRDKLNKLQNELKSCGAEVKWVEPQNIHLTLKFLGEILEDKLTGINQIIEDLTRDKAKFEIALSGLGVFPNTHHPKIIWAGIKDKRNEAKLIALGLEEKLQALGVPKEDREFLGHITIGRIKSGLNKDKLIEKLQTLGDELIKENVNFTADKLTLFKSKLTPSGPIYEVLKETNLKTT